MGKAVSKRASRPHDSFVVAGEAMASNHEENTPAQICARILALESKVHGNKTATKPTETKGDK